MLNTYRDLYIIDFIEQNNEYLFCFIIKNKDNEQGNGIRKIEIFISRSPIYYEIRSFEIKNHDEENHEERLLGSIKMEGILYINEIIKDLRGIIENRDNFRFYPNFPL